MAYLFVAPKLAFFAGAALFATSHPSSARRPFFARIFSPYRPELHYMRGPGSACRAKQAALLQCNRGL
jgi:hypothetical protein